MLIDAFKSETYRLSRNWVQVAVATLIVPILFVAGGAFVLLQAKAKGGPMAAMVGINPALPAAPLNLMDALMMGADKGANGVTLILMLIAAATLYVGDYRWETWRLISARNSRTNLLLGKLVVVGLLILAAQLLLLFSGLIEVMIRASILGRGLTFEATGQMVGQFFAVAGISWLGAIQFTMIGMLAAVLTRSLLAGLFVPIVVGVATAFSPQLLAGAGIEPDSWLAVLINPGAAIAALKAAVSHNPGAPPLPDGLLLKAIVSLTLWILAPLAAALALFQRQDLSKE